jgi:hypothetical protein
MELKMDMTEFTIKVHIPTVLCRLAAGPILIYRRWRYGYAYRIIPLTQGKVTKVGQRDFEKLRVYKWFAKRERTTWYARRHVKKNNKLKCFIMHRVIMNAPEGMVVDHINGDGLDNRRANLRVCTIQQNSCNRRIIEKGTSRYKGVSRSKGSKKWRAIIYSKNEQIDLGYFDNEIEAAKAYDEAALKYHGKFARLNFPKTGKNK